MGPLALPLCFFFGRGRIDLDRGCDHDLALLSSWQGPLKLAEPFPERKVHQALAVEVHDVKGKEGHRYHGTGLGPTTLTDLTPGAGAKLLKRQEPELIALFIIRQKEKEEEKSEAKTKKKKTP